jgi:hypothetical protein
LVAATHPTEGISNFKNNGRSEIGRYLLNTSGLCPGDALFMSRGPR